MLVEKQSTKHQGRREKNLAYFLMIGRHCRTSDWSGSFLFIYFFFSLFEKICPHNVNRAQMKERIEAELPEFHVQICEECCTGPLGRQCAWAL